MTTMGVQERTDTVITVNGVEVRFLGETGMFIEVENPAWKGQGGRPVGTTMNTWLQIAQLIIDKHEKNLAEVRHDGA